MYKLLIVDDEPEIVNWIFELFLEARGLELEIFKAYSAKEALVILDAVKIDIVLSDIKMPGINGLQLLERIKSNWPRCQVIFLTGYREFDYVYEAIQNGGVRYLLKTEGDQKILSTVQESIIDLEKSLRNEEIIIAAKLQMERVMPLLQEKYLIDLIEGFIKESEILQERFDELGIPFSVNNPVVVFVGRFDNTQLAQSSMLKYKNYLELKQIIEEYLPNDIKSAQIVNVQYNIVCIAQPDIKPYTGELQYNWQRAFTLFKGALEYMQDACRKTLEKTVSFAVYEEAFPINSLQEKFKCLSHALSCRIGIGTEMILLENDFSSTCPDKEAAGCDFLRETYGKLSKVKLLEKYMELGQKDDFFKLLHELCDDLIKEKSKSYNPALEVYYNVSMILLGFINRNNLTERVAFKIGLYKLTRADEHHTWNEAVIYLCNLSEHIFEILENEEERRAIDVIENVKKYINTHLNLDLTLVKLSDLVHFNPSYLSRLFKQVSGINLSDYILDARIEKAKELLGSSSLKINEISLEVGYESSHSFARFFRNSTGMSPQEFRASLINK